MFARTHRLLGAGLLAGSALALIVAGTPAVASTAAAPAPLALTAARISHSAVRGELSGAAAHAATKGQDASFLAAHAGSPQPRQRIAGLFWPESGEAQALTNLRDRKSVV